MQITGWQAGAPRLKSGSGTRHRTYPGSVRRTAQIKGSGPVPVRRNE